jgi:hypothetical protein
MTRMEIRMLCGQRDAECTSQMSNNRDAVSVNISMRLLPIFGMCLRVVDRKIAIPRFETIGPYILLHVGVSYYSSHGIFATTSRWGFDPQEPWRLTGKMFGSSESM